MKINEAQHLDNISARALNFVDIIRKSTTILRWLTNKTKNKRVTAWEVMIEPVGLDYSYRNMVRITLPRDIGAKEIRSLAKAVQAEAQKKLEDINFPTPKDC